MFKIDDFHITRLDPILDFPRKRQHVDRVGAAVSVSYVCRCGGAWWHLGNRVRLERRGGDSVCISMVVQGGRLLDIVTLCNGRVWSGRGGGRVPREEGEGSGRGE